MRTDQIAEQNPGWVNFSSAMPSSNQTGGSIPNRRSHLTTEVGQFQIGDRGSDLRRR